MWVLLVIIYIERVEIIFFHFLFWLFGVFRKNVLSQKDEKMKREREREILEHKELQIQKR